jgi:hypothetical protein
LPNILRQPFSFTRCAGRSLMSAGGILYIAASLAFVGILYLLADAQCHLSMSDRDYGDWVALPDEAKAAARSKLVGRGDLPNERRLHADNATGLVAHHDKRPDR